MNDLLKIDLKNIESFSYFDILAFIGNVSLHWGGHESTYQILELAEARSNMRILEIGCGTGVTSSALLACGVDLTVVEPSQSMLKAALNRCAKFSNKIPKSFNASIEDGEKFLPENEYDIVLIECVFGFINDKTRALKAIERSLKVNGKIAVIDFRYLTEPPLSVKQNLDSVGIGELLYKNDWENYFENFDIIHWKDVPLSSSEFSVGDIEVALKDSYFVFKDEQYKNIALLLYNKLFQYEMFFRENRKYMSGISALWKTR